FQVASRTSQCPVSFLRLCATRRVFWRWLRCGTTLDLNHDYLQGVSAADSSSRFTMVFANGQHIVTSCQRVRDATRRMRTFLIVTDQRAVRAAFLCASFQSTNAVGAMWSR